MRTEFDSWYPKDPESIAKIWKTAIFVPDANILLHSIRHPRKVRDELLRLFEVLGDALWIPYQVGLEFHRNRLDVERSSIDTYDQIVRDCEKAIGQARDKLRQLRAHPTIDIERELSALDMYIVDFKARIDVSKASHPTEDLPKVVARLNDLLKGKVGRKWSVEDLSKIKKEGELRYTRQVPPGYLDSKKTGDEYRKFGDLIIWRDMITKAKESERPVIFITDDVKEDWWWIHKGRKIGPRPELTEEFSEETGQEFHLYEFGNFIRTAASYHPEFEDDLAAVEKSLRQDTEARRRLSEIDPDTDMQRQVENLEDEREDLVTLLSGTPDTNIRPNISRNSSNLRARIKEIDDRLQELETVAKSI